MRRPQRLLFASTGTKDPALPKTLYITGLAAPGTVNTMPEETLLATAESEAPVTPLDPNPGDPLAPFRRLGIDIDQVGGELQGDGAKAFVKSWSSLLDRIAGKVAAAV